MSKSLSYITKTATMGKSSKRKRNKQTDVEKETIEKATYEKGKMHAYCGHVWVKGKPAHARFTRHDGYESGRGSSAINDMIRLAGKKIHLRPHSTTLVNDLDDHMRQYTIKRTGSRHNSITMGSSKLLPLEASRHRVIRTFKTSHEYALENKNLPED